jgi:hypothetical protein
MLFGYLLIRYWKKHPTSGFGDYGMSKGQQFFDREAAVRKAGVQMQIRVAAVLYLAA